MRILLIEDNPGDARLVQESLREAPGDFTLNAVEKLGLGLEFLLSQDVDVVLLDLSLPDSRGLDTLIKLQAGFSHLPVVIMTGSENDTLAVKALQRGAQDYLVKGQVDGKLLQRTLVYAIERKKTGDILRRQAALLDISPDAIFGWEIGGDIFSWNQGAEKLYGFTAADAIGHNPHDLLQPNIVDIGLFDEKLLRHGHWEGELTHTTRNSRQITVDSRMVVHQSGQQHAVLEVNRDITERKKAERLKDEFIGMVSHELRTPLTVVIGALSVATAEGLPQEQSRELIRDAATYADVLAGIVDNLLELSRHQSDRLALQTERSDIGQIAQDVIQKLQTRSDIHRLVVDIPSDAPAIFVDRVRIELVLYNLVENAIKYSPRGGEVRVLARQQDSQLLVSVSDHGVGISPEDQLKLFQSFERVQVYKKHLIPGLGLGLRVCRILVEAHGGQIWVESAPGKGTTFSFTVPLGDARRQVKS